MRRWGDRKTNRVGSRNKTYGNGFFLSTLEIKIIITVIKITPENPVLWTGMKGVSAKGRKKSNQMLKRVQNDKRVWFSVFVIPNLFRDLGFGFKNSGFKAPPCGRGSLLLSRACQSAQVNPPADRASA
jgi:hypothetical protein